jgi:hypothetical protein
MICMCEACLGESLCAPNVVFLYISNFPYITSLPVAVSQMAFGVDAEG